MRSRLGHKATKPKRKQTRNNKRKKTKMKWKSDCVSLNAMLQNEEDTLNPKPLVETTTKSWFGPASFLHIRFLNSLPWKKREGRGLFEPQTNVRECSQRESKRGGRWERGGTKLQKTDRKEEGKHTRRRKRTDKMKKTLRRGWRKGTAGKRRRGLDPHTEREVRTVGAQERNEKESCEEQVKKRKAKHETNRTTYNGIEDIEGWEVKRMKEARSSKKPNTITKTRTDLLLSLTPAAASPSPSVVLACCRCWFRFFFWFERRFLLLFLVQIKSKQKENRQTCYYHGHQRVHHCLCHLLLLPFLLLLLVVDFVSSSLSLLLLFQIK